MQGKIETEPNHTFGNKKVHQQNFSVDSLSQEFFYNGFIYKEFRQTDRYEKFYNILRDLYYKESINDGFSWKETYSSTFDLAPETFEYNNILVDILFDQKIPQLIKTCLGEDLYLGDMTFRNTFPGSGYMTWHRDTHNFASSAPSGRTPPLIKLIYYPKFDEKSSFQLKVCKGSHHRYFNSRIVDRLQTILTKPIKLMSSNQSFLLFNSFLYHGVVAQTNLHGAARLIFNFCPKSFLSQFIGKEKLHEYYMSKLHCQN